MAADAVTVVCVGPVDAEAARRWVAHELGNLALLRPGLEKLPFHVPADVLDEIESFLREWQVVAAADKPFRWCTAIALHRLQLLVRYWANLDLMTDELIDRLGISWAPPSSRPFFDALVAGVDRALRAGSANGTPDPFVRLLARG